ncbi:hypothetical protein [Streptomyces sp. V2I9]|uniref:hypothetical protein n=1 Tax=Streptomyces sp. V2I9 TaxID=3042304 RepID=UPI002782F279|nr:hypothetical protein [Streptomyces sp. V2I9]MDQ0988738.1 hypothetical protein [Streptomyces sp. V2I9]
MPGANRPAGAESRCHAIRHDVGKSTKGPESIAGRNTTQNVQKLNFNCPDMEMQLAGRNTSTRGSPVCSIIASATCHGVRKVAMHDPVVAWLVFVKDSQTLALVEDKCGSKQFGGTTAHMARGVPLHTLGQV